MVQKKDIACPTCGKKNTWMPDNRFRPFCSERCKLIDLGDWASEKHRVAGELVKSEEDSDEDDHV
ncbi:MAG: DNA gyrase inhibitor YacG [Gammaproteobacteria bacterium]|nr:MAG: DNA gyrase inhibitor YacG [Gammaproteobacteria bacterium]